MAKKEETVKPDIALMTEKEAIGYKTLIDTRERVNDKINEFNQQIMTKYGKTVQGVIKLAEPNEAGKQFFRVVVKDNLDKLKEGNVLWKSTGFTRYEVDHDLLKNEPK